VSCSLAGTADATTRPPLDAIQGPRSRRLQALLTSVLGPAKPVGVVHLVQPCPGGQPADLQQLPQVVLFGPIGVVTTYSVSPSSLSISLPVMLFTSATVTTLSVGLVSSSVPVRHVELPGWNHHDIRSSGEGEQGAEAGRIRDVPTARSG